MTLREELHQLVARLAALAQEHGAAFRVDWVEGRTLYAQRVELVVRIPHPERLHHVEYAEKTGRFHIPSPTRKKP